MPAPRPPCVVLVLLLAACGGGGSNSTPIGGADVPAELLACRARVDEPFRFAEIALRDARNLGTRRVVERTGTERGVRVHPDGRTLVFVRERDVGEADSREIFVSSTDGSRVESRLTQDTHADEAPCWSPDGTQVLFASDREGDPRLFVVSADGGTPARFRVQPGGTGEREPDWHAATDRVVFAERALDGRWFLALATGTGAGAGQLTQPPAGVGIGDGQPRFAPDGQTVVFVRRFTETTAALCRVVIATGDVAVLCAPDGDVATPCVAPANDRVFFGLAEPAAGRATLRLASVPIGGGTPVLVWPDERWRLDGLDLLPAMPAKGAAGTPVTADLLAADLQIATASSVFGARPQLLTADGDEFEVRTATINGREIGAISVRFDLPLADARDVEELRVRIVLRASRGGDGSVLRTSLYNPVDERFDTVVERPAATGATTLEYRTSSLRHVTAERQVRVTAIADLTTGARAELFVDQVELVIVPRAN